MRDELQVAESSIAALGIPILTAAFGNVIKVWDKVEVSNIHITIDDLEGKIHSLVCSKSMRSDRESLHALRSLLHITPADLCVKNLALFANLYGRAHSLSAIFMAIDEECESIEGSPTILRETYTDVKQVLNDAFHEFLFSGHITLETIVIDMLTTMMALAPEEHPGKHADLGNLGNVLLRRSQRLKNIRDADEAIILHRHAVALTPSGHPIRPTHMRDLASSLLWRFEHWDTVTDIRESIILQREAVADIPDWHSDKPDHLLTLGILYSHRFERFGDTADVTEAITALRQAAEIASERYSNKPTVLSNLGISLGHRYKHLGDPTDLNESIKLHREAVRLTPEGHISKPTCLNNLGVALSQRFAHQANIVDINEGIAVLSQAVTLIPDGVREKPTALQNLGILFLKRFMHVGSVEDMQEASTALHAAIKFTPEGHPAIPSILSSLGDLLLSQFQRFGDLGHLQEAIATHRKAVALTSDDHPRKPSRIQGLGDSFLTRFRRLGDIADINEAVDVFKQAIELAPDGYAEKAELFSELGESCWRRFEYSGNIIDIDESVRFRKKAISLTADGDPLRPGRLSNLGVSLMVRFERLGVFSDMGEALNVQGQAAALIPKGHEHRPTILSDLGASLLHRYEHSKNIADIDEAIKLRHLAVELSPDTHPDKPRHLSNLGMSFGSRFLHLKEITDVDQAILAYRRAIELTPDADVNRPRRLSSFGGALGFRFEKLKDAKDVDEAIVAQTQALELIPLDHVTRASILRNLGSAFLARFELFGDRSDIDKAIHAYKDCAQSTIGRAQDLFSTALGWAQCSARRDGIPAMDAWKRVIDLIPRVAWLGADIMSRYMNIHSIASGINEAVAACISLQDYDTAVEWMEQGRCIVWGQILNLRIPLDDLKIKEPDLSRRLRVISSQLETAGEGQSPMLRESSSVHTNRQRLEDEAQEHRKLTQQYEDLLAEIRSIPEFSDFLRPKRISKLLSSVTKNLVVMVNVDSNRCDALILQGHDTPPSHVPLPNFTLDTAKRMHTSLMKILVASNARVRDLNDRGTAVYQSPQRSTMESILEILWKNVVEPVISTCHPMSPNNLQHITWCVTGPLAFLPLHAAGLYTSPSGPKLFESTISSYTPSLTMLAEANRRAFNIQPLPRILAVSQPGTPNQRPLPGTIEEVKQIQNCVGNHIAIEWLNADKATVDAVLQGMETHSWCHLACHGIQNATNPTESSFALHDGSLTLREIMSKTFTSAEMAFLSACQTASGDEKVPEEAVHLAAGMMTAGYQTVFATMWSIGDKDAPLVAKEVYGYLLEKSEDEKGDKNRGAYALHHAVAKLRTEVGEKNFVRWVPFVHFGI